MSSDGIELGKLDWQVRARPPGSPSFERSDWIAKPWSSLVIGGVNCHKKICSTCMACMFDCWADPVVVHLLPLKSYMAKLSKQLPLHSCPGFDPQWNFEVKKDGWIKQSKRSKVWNFWKSLKSLIENLNCTLFASFFKKWANPGLFFVYFRSFQINNTIFTTNQCEKMSIQYPALGF